MSLTDREGNEINATRIRPGLFIVVLIGLDLGLKALAENSLRQGESLGTDWVSFEVGHNTGVAFGLGGALPSWLLMSVIAILTAGTAVFTWRAATTARRATVIGLSAVVAGAMANLIDRLMGGGVTDYIRVGWWPTFNLADTFITLGVLVAVCAMSYGDASRSQQDSRPMENSNDH